MFDPAMDRPGPPPALPCREPGGAGSNDFRTRAKKRRAAALRRESAEGQTKGARERGLSSSGSDQAREGRLVDALAARGDEGRGTLR